MENTDKSAAETKPRRRFTPEELVTGLKYLLTTEQLEDNRFKGAAMGKPGKPTRQRAFGGQVIAQGVNAAMATIEDNKTIHSLHAYFMRPGDDGQPIEYAIDRDFDGRSFSNRRVTAIQEGKPILTMATSFQIQEDGFTHQTDMPDVPPPEDLKTDAEHLQENIDKIPEHIRRFITRQRPVELRPTKFSMPDAPEKRAPLQHTWFRLPAPVEADQNMHRAMLAFTSDMGILAASMLPHGVNWWTKSMQAASLDHAVWFPEDINMNEWMLYVMESPWAGHARGMTRGTIFTRDGRLVASVSQEGLTRQHKT